MATKENLNPDADFEYDSDDLPIECKGQKRTEKARSKQLEEQAELEVLLFICLL